MEWPSVVYHIQFHRIWMIALNIMRETNTHNAKHLTEL
jgi:hypothetical protein